MIKLEKWQLALILLGNFLFTWFVITAYVKNNLQTITLSKIIIPKDNKYNILEKGLHIVNPEGKEIASFFTGSLLVYNKQGAVIGKISTDENGGRLGIYNNQGQMVGTIVAGEQGGVLVISNNQGKAAGGIATSMNGGSLAIFNNLGQVVGTMAPEPLGAGRLVLSNSLGTPVWTAPLLEL